MTCATASRQRSGTERGLNTNRAAVPFRATNRSGSVPSRYTFSIEWNSVAVPQQIENRTSASTRSIGMAAVCGSAACERGRWASASESSTIVTFASPRRGLPAQRLAVQPGSTERRQGDRASELENRIERSRDAGISKDDRASPAEEVRAGTKRREQHEAVGAVVPGTAVDRHHAFVEVVTVPPELPNQRVVVARVHQTDRSDGSAQAHELDVTGAERALAVVDDGQSCVGISRGWRW